MAAHELLPPIGPAAAAGTRAAGRGLPTAPGGCTWCSAGLRKVPCVPIPAPHRQLAPEVAAGDTAGDGPLPTLQRAAVPRANQP